MQTTTITGTVTDQQNVPLGGVSIVVKGTTKGVSTNFDGQYEIEASDVDSSSLDSSVWLFGNCGQGLLSLDLL